jgi:hypothetical protein
MEKVQNPVILNVKMRLTYWQYNDDLTILEALSFMYNDTYIYELFQCLCSLQPQIICGFLMVSVQMTIPWTTQTHIFVFETCSSCEERNDVFKHFEWNLYFKKAKLPLGSYHYLFSTCLRYGLILKAYFHFPMTMKWKREEEDKGRRRNRKKED